MAFQIAFFNYSGENEVVNKGSQLNNRFNVDGVLKDESSIIDPTVLVEFADVPGRFNYMCIIPFKRYYYITDIKHINNKLWQITGHVDVLYSFAGDIRNSKAVIDKSEVASLSNLYYDDGSFVLESRKYNKFFNFPTSLPDTGQLVLICAGGA